MESRIQRLRQSTRFEPSADVLADVELIEEPGGPPAGAKPGRPPAPEQEPQADSYTDRLLKAKKKAWEKRKD